MQQIEESIEEKYQSFVQTNEDRRIFIENTNYYMKLNTELKLEIEQNACNAAEHLNLDTLNTLVESTLATVSLKYYHRLIINFKFSEKY